MEAGSAEKKRNWWIWISVALALVCVGLLVWGLSTKSDLDDANDQLAKANGELSSTQSDLEKTKQDQAQLEDEAQRRKLLSGAALTGFKAGFDAIQEELGTTSQDLEQTQQDLAQSEKDAEKAAKEADQAKQDAKQATNETEKANAEAEQARAEADAAESKASILADCGKAFIGSFGLLFEGDNPEDQVQVLKDELSSISDTCKAAFEQA